MPLLSFVLPPTIDGELWIGIYALAIWTYERRRNMINRVIVGITGVGGWEGVGVGVGVMEAIMINPKHITSPLRAIIFPGAWEENKYFDIRI